MSDVAARSINGAQQILHVQNPDDIVGFVAPDRQTRVGSGDHCANELARGKVGIDSIHLGSMHHDVFNDELVQFEQSAEHVAFRTFDAAVAMQKIDGAP